MGFLQALFVDFGQEWDFVKKLLFSFSFRRSKTEFWTGTGPFNGIKRGNVPHLAKVDGFVKSQKLSHSCPAYDAGQE